MSFPDQFAARQALALAFALLAMTGPALALESDRQKPLEVNADSTDGVLGDGVTVLRGHVVIRQGSLLIRADEAEVEKVDGKVRLLTLRGLPAFLEQEIEQQGHVQAEANTMTYQLGPGLVTLTGNADVSHPQYQISGDELTYDLNAQHFMGTSTEDGNGRIFIRMDPEVVNPGGAPEPEAAGPAEDSTGDGDG